MKQFQNQQGDQNDPAPGSLGFVPSTPETPPAATPEKTSTPEKQPVVEKPGAAPASPTQPTTDTTTPQITPASAVKPKTPVVDKTDKITELHHVQHPKDKLTSIADIEEEEFISEVETAHGHK